MYCHFWIRGLRRTDGAIAFGWGALHDEKAVSRSSPAEDCRLLNSAKPGALVGEFSSAIL
jgi:hypothetical protein